MKEFAWFLYLKTKLLGLLPIDRNHKLLFKTPSLQENSSEKRARVAFICDEMTWCDYSGCCDSIFLHPRAWKEQLDAFQPEMLFCESAWSGIDGFEEVWRGRIYRDRRVSFENRDVLLEILQYCREHGIVTVFWNKEDPYYYDHPVYDFSATALLFDCLLTTDAGCVARYQERGHSNVHLLPFGVNLSMFYPVSGEQREGTALFAGSWCGDMPQRCAALDELLSYGLEQGWELDIYDRRSTRPEKRFRFPKKYAKYIRKAVPYHRVADVYRRYQYGINVNTVVDSPTMLSRRVLQLAACGVTVVTNDAKALERYRDCLRIWTAAEGGPVFARGIPQALSQYSTQRQFLKILKTAGITRERVSENV